MHEAFNHKLAKWQVGDCLPSALGDARQTVNKERKLAMSAEDQKDLAGFRRQTWWRPFARLARSFATGSIER